MNKHTITVCQQISAGRICPYSLFQYLIPNNTRSQCLVLCLSTYYWISVFLLLIFCTNEQLLFWSYSFAQMTYKSYFRNILRICHRKPELLAKNDHLHKDAWRFELSKAFLYLNGLKEEVISQNGALRTHAIFTYIIIFAIFNFTWHKLMQCYLGGKLWNKWHFYKW